MKTVTTREALAGVFFRIGEFYAREDLPLAKTLFGDTSPTARATALLVILGAVARDVRVVEERGEEYSFELRSSVQAAAATTCIWLGEYYGRADHEPLHEALLAERAEQLKKYGAEHYASLTLTQWATVLGEEMGEVAQAAYRLERGQDGQGALVVELIQVAAVAVAWLEVLEGALS